VTDRIHSITVVLEKDIRDDDCEGLMNAIRHMRGVADVSGHVSDIGTHMAEVRARIDVSGRLIDLARDIRKGT
jgi:hypothetical protein